MDLGIDSLLDRRGIGATLMVGLLVVGLAGLTGSGGVQESETLQGVEATVYKSPNCGCCGEWASYAERYGMDVDVENVQDMDEVKERNDVPSELYSCHTTVIGDYVVEGHVPVGPVEKLLQEEPDVRGIGMPGMPQGSPGMPGPKQEEWVISSFDADGETSEFMKV